jgi:hypothetical protein
MTLWKAGWASQIESNKFLWDRGLLDPDTSCVMKIKNDPNHEGKVVSSVFSGCPDFLNKKTCLIYLGDSLGFEVHHSTKCHPELAGEGIEYTRGWAKCVYQ